MIYKLSDGDIVKILPILKKDGTFTPVLSTSSFYIGNKIIYDTPENLLKNALHKRFLTENDTRLNPLRLFYNRTAICILHEGQIKFSMISKKLIEKITSDYKFDPRNNHHLKVSIQMVNSGSIGHLPSFDKSEIIEQDWKKPNIDIDNQQEWIDWLKTNQPFYIEDFIENHNVYKYIDVLKKEGLTDYIYEIIAENREKKINQVLT